MSFRAILLGLLGVAAICGLSYFNDAVLRQPLLVGNHMPISVYGSLLLFLLIVNPLLRRIGRPRPLTGAEIAVALSLTLAACCIPGAGLMRTFTTSLVLPHHYARTDPGWQEQRVLERVPPVMLAQPASNDASVVNGFIQGLGSPGHRLRLDQIPWSAWWRPLAFWLPLLLLFWIGLIALSVVVHRQWADHEQLPYPLAAFVRAFLPSEGGARSPIFLNRLFWIGALVILAIHLNNYGCRWFPRHMIRVPTLLDFSPLSALFPTIRQGSYSDWPLLYAPIYFSVIAIAYFLAADVSLSLGLGGYLFAYVSGVLAGYGISIWGGGIGPGIQHSLGFGAYLGMLLVMLYTGRRYYWQVARRAIGLRSDDDVGRTPVWAARVFLLCIALFTGALRAIGLDWLLAVCFTGGMVMLFLVMSRILAETGVFFNQPYWLPGMMITGFLGAGALGPQAVLLMALLSTVFLVDPREALMPFVVNALKLSDTQGVRIGKVALWAGAAVIVGLAVAVPVTLYFQYDRGVNMSDAWSTAIVPRAAFDETVRVIQRLRAQDVLETSEALHGWQRLAHASPMKSAVIPAAAGLGLILLTTAARLRFPRWPLHPVMFLMWFTTYAGWAFCPSLLIGWLIKTLVTRYGGAAGYQRIKPLMFGAIAGDMLGGVVPIIIGFVYHFLTGEIPKPYGFMP